MTLSQEELDDIEFVKPRRNAMWLLLVAAGDYASCRCLLLNGLMPGLVLAAQAVEKILKAYVEIRLGNRPKKHGHDLLSLVAHAETLGMLNLSVHRKTIERLMGHYYARYPDDERRSLSAGTGELSDIDRLVHEIYKQLPLSEGLLLRTGIYSQLNLANVSTQNPPEKKWLLENNSALQALVPHLKQRYAAYTDRTQSARLRST